MFEKAVTTVNRAFVIGASILVLLIALAVFQDVLRRYLLGAPSLWAMDFSRYALFYVFFLGLAPALQSGHHVSVDLFDRLWPRFLGRMMPYIAALLCLAFGLLLTWFVWRLTARTFASNPLAQTIVPIRLKYIHMIAPVGCIQFVLTALMLMLRLNKSDDAGDPRSVGG
jgi:TRAP-type C4-dicarboxylate transport system permease small subunit